MLTTHQDTCCLGFTYDTAAITDVDRMRRCMREAFAAAVAPAPVSDTRTAAGPGDRGRPAAGQATGRQA